MKSSLLIVTKTILFFIMFSFFTGNIYSQYKSFIGTETLKQGDKSAVQTLPEVNTSKIESLYEHLNGTPSIDGERYVLDGSIIWIAADATAIANTVRLDDNGETPVTAWGLNSMRVSRYSEASNNPVWEFITQPVDAAADVAGNGDFVAVAKAQNFYILNESTGSVTYELALADSFYASAVAVSRDGDRLVFLAQAYGGSNTARAYCLDLSGSTPAIDWTYDAPANVITNWAGVSISASGERVVLMGRNYFYVLNALTGNVIWDHFMDNTESPAAISGNGNIIATANNSGFVQTWVYDSGTTDYSLLWQYRIAAGAFTNWASSVGISADGSTIVAGTLIFLSGGYDGSIIAFDTYGNGTPKWIYAGAADLVDDIAVSDDGKVAAAVTWGDLAHAKPDLYVFDVQTGELAYSEATPGSFFTVDLSADGSRVIAGGKAVHAREFGNGGRTYYSSVNLGGGNVSGTVDLAGTTNDSGVLVKALGTVRTAVTDVNGNYLITNIPAGTYQIRAEKPGYNFGSVSGVIVTAGNTTSGVNFVLAAYAGTAPVLNASTGLVRKIDLNWTPLMTEGRLKELGRITGDSYHPELYDVLSRSALAPHQEISDAMNGLLADSIAIFRSLVQGGPYNKIASVDAAQNTYTDSAVFPLKKYYYVVTRFNEIGQSNYSNEAVGMVSDTLLTFSFEVPQSASIPTFDGVISPGEWTDAVKVDISDVFGYGSGTPKPQGSVYLYMKFNQSNKMLYIAGEDFLNTTLDNNDGFGFYLDDNNNNNYEPNGALSVYQEGNYWAYWHPTGSLVRFRQLFTGGGVGTVDTLFNMPVGFSVSSGHLQGEFAIPMGFNNGNELQVYSPDRTVGLGAFLRDGGTTLFNGWWPQTMNSVFNPQYFGDVKIDVALTAPPQPPDNIVVTQQGNDLLVTWDDPTLGLNFDPLPVPPVINIYKNGDFLASFNAGTETYLDEAVECERWYEYQFEAYIITGTDTFYSPRSNIVGEFACQSPVLTSIKYDDGSWEAFYVVDFTFDDNKFALRVTPTFYPARVMRFETLVNSRAQFDFTIHADNAGTPGNLIAGPYRSGSTSFQTVSTVSLTLPGNEPPIFEDGDFWVLINYLPESPGAPGIGVDNNQPITNRGKYYTATNGWNDFAAGNLMITAYITGPPPSGINDNTEIPVTFDLMQNYPNPFNPTTIISYQLPQTEMVTLEIFNSLGQRVATLVNEIKYAGNYSVTWNSKNYSGELVSSGIYFYKIKAGQFSQVKKMMMLR